MNSKQILSLSAFAMTIATAAAGNWNAGDTIALLIGIAMFFVLLLALLGWISRKK
ncbi:hypothetical protein DDB_G0282757 [Dictyostelium discoideum AX4]|uniref:Uncharacterized transmembrane protein DDB_G0282757 n=1 Tax=Dictyostelium discoideum TaxID=44689 RepID=Y8379_DICDI|nr:hypothetical protein DDB_G0282757 [Dictyostelium discoideum AX4]Q54SJ4.1 RecName: Full=Uncharacterized transmembrane protein DDB_G0282757; Flags: Precursor [Dictyostelium discoideum]EAL66238.1 hypothetical protein DDB_G0282757 [Dictyostelium discoideum AX4]|eukprot:XP_640045.1 hypothetical protein DDB_G0282757 [Dictyostelium discoideum AX4]